MTTLPSAAQSSELDKKTLEFIDGIATNVRASIEGGELPAIEVPVRGLGNVTYSQARGYFDLGPGRKLRTLTVNTARAFAQTLRMMAASRTMVARDDFATKREAYYISKNCG